MNGIKESTKKLNLAANAKLLTSDQKFPTA